MKKTNLAIAICLASASAAYAQTEIDEVLVYGQQMNSEAETGSRLNLTPLETPATIDVISGDNIRSRIDLTVLDAVVRSGGFTGNASPGNGGTSITARGFSGQGSVTKLFDGQNYYTAYGTITAPFDTWAVERIEVLKGPSSVLYGQGGIGGAINTIPKSASHEVERDVRLTLGENNTSFLGFGASGGITDELAYRVDISNNRSDNWVRNGESESTVFAGALEWQASEKLTLTARYDYGDQDPMVYLGTVVDDGDFHPDFVGENFNPTDSFISYTDDSLRLKAEYEVSDTMSFDSEIYRMTADRKWASIEGFNLITDASGDPESIEREWITLIGHDMEQLGWRSNLSFASNLGGIEIKNNIGLELTDVSFIRPTNFAGDPDLVDPYDPDLGSLGDFNDLVFYPNVDTGLDQIGIFAESQIKFTDQVAVVLGLRYEDIDTETYFFGSDSTLDQQVDDITGRLGLVYDLSESTALYGQYSTGSEHPRGGVVSVRSSLAEADLTRTEQLEFGVKQHLVENRLSWGLALFDITKNDQIILNGPGDADDQYVQEQTSQGIELSMDAQLSDSFSMYANLVSLDAEVTDTGSAPDLVPETTFNMGIAMNLTGQITWFADGRHVGSRDFQGAEMSDYSVIDTSLRYQFDSGLALTAKLDNAFDEIYASAGTWTGAWLVGKRRTFSLTADLSF